MCDEEEACVAIVLAFACVDGKKRKIKIPSCSLIAVFTFLFVVFVSAFGSFSFSFSVSSTLIMGQTVSPETLVFKF